MFKLKLVEIEIDEEAESAQDVMAKVDQLQTRIKLTSLLYFVVIFSFALFHIIFGFVWIF